MFLIFTPKPGEMIQFDEHLFQMAWKPTRNLLKRCTWMNLKPHPGKPLVLALMLPLFCVLSSWYFVSTGNIPIGSMYGIYCLYLPYKSTIHVGKYTLFPWILWIFVIWKSQVPCFSPSSMPGGKHGCRGKTWVDFWKSSGGRTTHQKNGKTTWRVA